MKRTSLTILVLWALAVPPADARSAQSMQFAQAGSTVIGMTDGEARKVDKDTGTITLKHGEIKNLRMSPMTMVFEVKDKAMLDNVKAGDKVRFAAEAVGPTMKIVQIEPAK